MKNFRYNIPTKILFGKGMTDRTGKETVRYAKKILLVSGGGSVRKNGLYRKITDSLEENGICFRELNGVEPNPDIESVRQGIKICRDENLDFVLAVGGGSVIDCAKAVAAGYFYEGDAWDFFARRVRVEKALPVASVLTLSATGSEMNGNTVISNRRTREKIGLGSDLLRPVFSVLDPENTYTVPEYQTASGAVDIFVHVIEQYFSPETGTFLQDRMAEAVLRTVIRYAPEALSDPENYEARSNLMWAGSLALNGLLSCGKTGDWSSHGIEHELSAFYGVTHGAGLAVILPAWMRYVCDSPERKERFRIYAAEIWGIRGGDAEEKGIEATGEFFRSLGMPSTLKQLGVVREDLDKMAEQAVRFGLQGNFKKLAKDDVRLILSDCYE